LQFRIFKNIVLGDLEKSLRTRPNTSGPAPSNLSVACPVTLTNDSKNERSFIPFLPYHKNKILEENTYAAVLFFILELLFF